MHAVVIGLMLGYVVIFLTYNPREDRFTFSTNTVFALITLAGSVVVLVNYFDLFAEKFVNLESEEDFVNKVNYTTDAGSAYLNWIDVTSTAQGLLYSPVKMFYFLFSPIPLDWRGVSDAAAFFLDSSVYLWLCFAVYRTRNNRQMRWRRILSRCLMISAAIAVFVFAYGTYNSGTAVRHRAKIFSMLLVIYAASRDGKRDIIKQPSAATLQVNNFRTRVT